MNESLAIASALLEFKNSCVDERSPAEKEYQIQEYAAAAALGLDLYDGETEIDAKEKEEDLYESEKDMAISLSLKDDDGDSLMTFLEQLEAWYDEEHDPKFIAKRKNVNETGDVHVKRLLADTGIRLPY